MFKKNNNKRSSDHSTQTPMNINTVIAEEMIIAGNISGEESIRIDGRVKGDLNITSTVILGEKSVIEGDIYTNHIVLYGKAIGNISCKSLDIKTTGHLIGNIDTESIDIEKGGIVNGLITMKAESENTPLLIEGEKQKAPLLSN